MRPNLEHLVKIHMRRLDALKKQQATLGVHAPPHILIEIQDIEAEIEKLGGSISPYKPAEAAPKIERAAACPHCKGPIKLIPRRRDDKSLFVIYSLRVDTSIECGYCGAIIPNQFATDEEGEVTGSDIRREIKEVVPSPLILDQLIRVEETSEVTERKAIQETHEAAESSTKRVPFAWLFNFFRSKLHKAKTP